MNPQSHTKLALALCVFLISCASDPAPPFHYRVLQSRTGDNGSLQSVVELDFENYSAGLMSAPVTLDLSDSSGDASIVVEVGACASYGCAGHIQEEVLIVTVNPAYPDHVLGFRCVGVDGGVSSGIDATFFGACEN